MPNFPVHQNILGSFPQSYNPTGLYPFHSGKYLMRSFLSSMSSAWKRVTFFLGICTEKGYFIHWICQLYTVASMDELLSCEWSLKRGTPHPLWKTTIFITRHFALVSIWKMYVVYFCLHVMRNIFRTIISLEAISLHQLTNFHLAEVLQCTVFLCKIKPAQHTNCRLVIGRRKLGKIWLLHLFQT